MSDPEIDETVGFLKAVRDAPKTAVSFDQVSGNLTPSEFDALSHYYHDLGYINRTNGTLDSRVVFATITAKGREFIRQHSR